MLTGELRSQIDSIWNAFWSGGISNPMEVMEQITYLLFLRRLDDLHTLEENKSTRTDFNCGLRDVSCAVRYHGPRRKISSTHPKENPQ